MLTLTACTVPAQNTEGEASTEYEATESAESSSPEGSDTEAETDDGEFCAVLNSEAELISAVSSEDFLSSDTATLEFASAFTVTKDVIIPRHATIVFNARPVFEGGTVFVMTDAEGEICVTEGGVGAFDLTDGSLIIDAPRSALTVSSKKAPPSLGEISALHNIASYNGETSPTGGTLDAEFSDIYPEGCEGTFYTVEGCSITVFIPYSVKDGEYKGARTVCETAHEYTADGELLRFSDGDDEFVYKLNFIRVTHDIPVLHLNTDGEINSKSEYVTCTLNIDGAEYSASVKGRGNASWNIFPKKGYRIRLDEGAELLGLEKDRDFVLISAYPDQSLIRNAVGLSMSSVLDGLEYTPNYVICDLFLNGEYRGVYTLAEKIEFSKDKLDYKNTSEPSYLLEVGWDFNDEMVYGKNFFDSRYIERIVIKEPDIEVKYSDEAKYIIEYLKKTEAAIEALDGYEEYIDVDSFIDFMIALELSCNTESAFYRSCYFYLPDGGKLKFGPMWDFDMAFGNHNLDNDDYDTLFTVDTPHPYLGKNGVTWFTLLWEDESFREKVAARWNEVKEELLSAALNTLDAEYERVRASADENFNRWDILGKKVGESPKYSYSHDSYEEHIEYLRQFITSRYEFLDSYFN